MFEIIDTSVSQKLSNDSCEHDLPLCTTAVAENVNAAYETDVKGTEIS